MPETFASLCEQYGSPKLIPDRKLYDYVAEAKIDLINRAKIEDISKSPLGIEVCRRARQDLYFLTKYFLWDTNPESVDKTIDDNLIVRHVHQRLADMFVQKDNSKAIADLDGEHLKKLKKRRIILYPRGSFKSTFDISDAVQWILNFPAIRILFITAAEDLAVAFCDTVKGIFIKKNIEPTLMNLFFPEFCIGETKAELGDEFSFTCPLWRAKQIRRNEPTIMASSIGSTLSGFHFEVIKADDAVDTKNSGNEDQCQKVIKNFGINIKMLQPFGFLDLLGTRYADEDLYGDAMAKNLGDIVTERGPCWELTTNKDTGQKILIGRAWEVKKEIQVQIDKGEFNSDDLAKEHYDYLFPERLSYEYCMAEIQQYGIVSFEGQYNQNPTPTLKTDFDKAILIKNTIPHTELPWSGPVSQTWDFAFSTKKGRDYTTCSTALWDDSGRMFIIDIVRDRFNPSQLAKKIVEMAMKYRPFVIGIENAGGSEMIDPAVWAEAAKTGRPDVIAVCGKIDWIKTERDDDAKRNRMRVLHPWLVNGKLKFVSHLPFLNVLYDEFQKCLRKTKHDDIPDVISRQVRYAPAVQKVMKKEDVVSWNKADAGWNLIYEQGCDAFGRIGFGPQPVPIVQIQPEREIKADTPDGYDPILGAGIVG